MYTDCIIYIVRGLILSGIVKDNKPEVPCSTPGSTFFSLVFIKNLIINKSKETTNMLIFVLYSRVYSPGPNMYKSTTY